MIAEHYHHISFHLFHINHMMCSPVTSITMYSRFSRTNRKSIWEIASPTVNEYDRQADG